MNECLHYDITRRLDSVKASGLITDYWVSWVGSNGHLQPKVCSWITDGDEDQLIRDQIALVLNGLVARDNIAVKADELCVND